LLSSAHSERLGNRISDLISGLIAVESRSIDATPDIEGFVETGIN
jgi:hypothetical protein